MLLAKGLAARHLRPSNFLLAALVLVLFLHVTKPWKQRQHHDVSIGVKGVTRAGPFAEEEYLKRLADNYNLTNQTKWQAWRVQPEVSRKRDSQITHVRARLGRQPETVIDLHSPTPSAVRASKRITLPVRTSPQAPQSDASEFLFGISTSYKRIADKNWALLRSWERWLTDGKQKGRGAGMVLMLDRATDKELQELGDKLAARGIDAHLVSTRELTSMAMRYHELVRAFKTYSATLAASGHVKRWFGLVEETVFFPDLSYLRERLAAHDKEDELYLGLAGERRDLHVDGTNSTAFSGGTVLLTRGAVDRLPRLPCLQTERSRSRSPVRPKRWDTLLQGCVKRYTGLDMHIIPPAAASPADNRGGGDGSARAESDGRPLVLRGYQDRYDVDVGMGHLVADVCGEPCFMQRYLFRDDWVLVNGLSLTHYPDGAGTSREGAAKSLTQDAGGRDAQKTVSATPSRERTWHLLDSAKAEDGSVWQAYLKRGTRRGGAVDDGEDEELDSLIVLIWERVTR